MKKITSILIIATVALMAGPTFNFDFDTVKKMAERAAEFVPIRSKRKSFGTDNLRFSILCDKTLDKKAFKICYSCQKRTPNAVLYTLYADRIDARNLDRGDIRFRPDYQLPKKCRAYSRDYSRTGYDRGHLAPNAAFDYDPGVQRKTFLLSNIAPQKPKLNRKTWAGIERFARMQARKYGAVDVITGVCGHKERLHKRVTAPKWWYKIISTPKGVMAFLTPNTNDVDPIKIRKYLVDPAEIEQVCKKEGVKVEAR
jgi:endonuclease G